MPYCSQCGVEVHKKTENCPLCHAPIQKLYQDEHPERHYPNQASTSAPLPPLSIKERLRLARGISIIAFLIPIFFTTAIDYFINGQISWSYYVIISLAGILCITLVSLFLPKRPGWINLLTHGILLLIVFSLNLLTGINISWSWKIATPILLFSWGITQLILKTATYGKGHLLASSILVGVGFLNVVVEGAISFFFAGRLILGWSLIVISALIPTALLLLYLYSAKFKKSKIRRFMHL